MILDTANLGPAAQPRQRTQALTAEHPVLYAFTKLVFPRMPRLVRERKMRILCVTSLLVMGLCASVAVMLWLVWRVPPA